MECLQCLLSVWRKVLKRLSTKATSIAVLGLMILVHAAPNEVGFMEAEVSYPKEDAKAWDCENILPRSVQRTMISWLIGVTLPVVYSPYDHVFPLSSDRLSLIVLLKPVFTALSQSNLKHGWQGDENATMTDEEV